MNSAQHLVHPGYFNADTSYEPFSNISKLQYMPGRRIGRSAFVNTTRHQFNWQSLFQAIDKMLCYLIKQWRVSCSIKSWPIISILAEPIPSLQVDRVWYLEWLLTLRDGSLKKPPLAFQFVSSTVYLNLPSDHCLDVFSYCTVKLFWLFPEGLL